MITKRGAWALVGLNFLWVAACVAIGLSALNAGAKIGEAKGRAAVVAECQQTINKINERLKKVSKKLEGRQP